MTTALTAGARVPLRKRGAFCVLPDICPAPSVRGRHHHRGAERAPSAILPDPTTARRSLALARRNSAMLISAVTGAKPKMGDNATVRI